ncbi:hypothetical protein MmiAt1_08620 [Methanimicrococcus sp. At1]|uniref:Uncharacterized protein n=1 Tax=Methanimicrococcus hacksteinii TaxID=3028293 RepID=A0ABU3VPE7_9EURY|nr:hypothetical protein [Methanimicrococcus sp. At1]
MILSIRRRIPITGIAVVFLILFVSVSVSFSGCLDTTEPQKIPADIGEMYV